MAMRGGSWRIGGLAALLLVAACSQKAAEEAPAPGDRPGVEAPLEPEEESPPAMSLPPATNGDHGEEAAAGAEPPDGPPAPVPGVEPAAPPATGGQAGGTQTGAALPFCDLVEERIPAEECAMLRNVARGTGAFRTPERMRKGEQASVTLVVSRTADSDAPSRALEGVPGKEGRFAPAVGRFIEASLIPGPGLSAEIDPATPALQDLYASDEALWRWTVTAMETGRHDLTIRTRVMTRRPDGSFAPRGSPFTDSRTVEVYVAGAAAIEEKAKAADRALKAVGEPTGSLTKLLTGLGGLVAAAGALWLALRNFGKSKAKDGDG